MKKINIKQLINNILVAAGFSLRGFSKRERKLKLAATTLEPRARGIFGLLICFCIILISNNFILAAFNNISRGVRPTGMGGAFIAVSDDINAILYNPGGLAQVDMIETSFMYSKLYTGLDSVDLGINYFAVCMPIMEKNTIGFGWTNFASANEYKEDIFYLSFSRQINDYLSGGINLKYLGHKYSLDYRTINDPVFASGDSKYNFTVDLGALSSFSINDENKNIYVGLALKNITQPDVGLKTKDTVPMELGIGIAYQVNSSIIPAIDINYRFQEWGDTEQKLNFKLGAETWFLDNMVGVRGGFNLSEISLGFSVNPLLWNLDIQFDYSFLWPLEIQETSGTHLLSLSFRFE